MENKKEIFYDRDKLHIIYYINVESIDEDDVQVYMEDVANEFKDTDGSTCPKFYPYKGEHNPPIEFYWPPYTPKTINEYNKKTED